MKFISLCLKWKALNSFCTIYTKTIECFCFFVYNCFGVRSMIERKEYMNKLIGYKDKHIIKVITGVRRCGKSTLLKLFQNYLRENGVETEQIVAINFEAYEADELRSPEKLYQYLTKRIVPGKMVYIFLDEVQCVTDFQRVIDSLFLKEYVDIYITGSNAYMLSGELATLLAGRYVEISMLPFSFAEYVTALKTENVDDAYRKYIEDSSFPFSLNLTHEQTAEYLSGIFDTIVVKDIITRKKYPDTMMLKSILCFLLDNIGNQLSTKKISDMMQSNGRSINVRTVESYIEAFLESYIVYQAKRYDVKGKQYLKTLDKYYIVDIGFRNALLGNQGRDAGHILENVIYLELRRRGYDVFIGKVGSAEVDFVAKNTQGIKYIQVAATVRDPQTLERELKPLQSIHDHYAKCVLTLDNDPEADYDGIRVINALDFLLNKTEI